MKPSDLRNATFAGLRQGLEGARKDVYAAWLAYGPGTTREVSAKSGIDLLTFRPRTTDLFHLGLVEMVSAERSNEGVYRAVPQSQWEIWRQTQISGQLQMAI